MSNPFTYNAATSTYTATQASISLAVISPGTFTLIGDGGTNTLALGTSLESNYTFTKLANGEVKVDSLTSASGGALLHATLSDIQILTFNSGAQTLNLDTYFGTPTPTYALTAATPSVNEGAHDSITLATTNVASGTAETYTISGIAANRLTSGTLTGQVTVDASGHAVIDLGVIANNQTDGLTTATITIGNNLASTSVTVNDTSLSPSTTGTAGNDNLIGPANTNNTFNATTGTDTINGGSTAPYINTVVYNQADGGVSVNSSGAIVVQKTSGGTDTLTNVERLKFTNDNIAFDVINVNTGITGNAGTAAKILGAVMGTTAVSTPQYEGIIIGLLDGGMSYAGLMQALLNYIGDTTSTAIATTLINNIAPAYASLIPTIVSMMGNNPSASAAGSVETLLADWNAANTNNIDLVGWQSKGIHYV